MNSLRELGESFKLKREYLYAILVDAGFFAAVYFLGKAVFSWLMKGAMEVTGGKSAEALKQQLVSLTPEQLEIFSGQIKWYAVELIGSLALFPLAVLLLYSASQLIIWKVINKSNTRYTKWVLLHLIISVMLVIWILLYLIIKIPLSYLPGMIDSAVLIFMVVCFLVFMLLAQGIISKRNQIWVTIGEAFKALQGNQILFGFALFFVLQLLQYPLGKYYAFHPTVSGAVQAVLFLLLMGWLRFYTGTAVEHSK